MLHSSLQATALHAIPIHCVTEKTLESVLKTLPVSAANWCEATGFKGSAGSLSLIPDTHGALKAVLFGTNEKSSLKYDALQMGRLATALPAGVYELATLPADFNAQDVELATLAFVLGGYKFTRYKKSEAKMPRLLLPKGVDGGEVSRIASAVMSARDLINTPATDMSPEALQRAAEALAKRFNARVSSIQGEALLKANFPMIHAVGRAADQEPRLVEIIWGEKNDPKGKPNPSVTLVGKGVCFDTGGLDIKPESNMLLMKKDMGGAAAALAAAEMIMGAALPVYLRVLVPIVENSISAASFRPGDVLISRKGLSVEIGNTDAEGRLILGDALTYGAEEAPDLMVDFATLTGAARVALGPDLPPFFTSNETLAAEIMSAAARVSDPVWRLPLWSAYESLIDTPIADVNNAGKGGFAGAITAALFLNRFIEGTNGARAKAHVHFDIYGWVPSAKPARSEGGEVQAARLVYDLVKARALKN